MHPASLKMQETQLLQSQVSCRYLSVGWNTESMREPHSNLQKDCVYCVTVNSEMCFNNSIQKMACIYCCFVLTANIYICACFLYKCTFFYQDHTSVSNISKDFFAIPQITHL